MALRRGYAAWTCALVATIVAAYVASSSAVAATSSTVVGATVPSATSLSTTGCQSDTPNVTDFGSLLPGTNNVTSLDCTATFGSSNDSSMLRLYQADQLGKGMWRSTNGPLDTSFNGTGIKNDVVGAGTDVGNDVVVQPDGKIVVAGYTHNGTDDDILISRVTAAGVPDPSWGGTGTVTTPIGAGEDRALAVAVAADGSVYVAGRTSNGTDYDWVTVRYTPLGALDLGWGGTGKVVTSLGAGNDELEALAIQPDGRVVVAGRNGSNQFAVGRYTTGGVLDPTFNGTGWRADTACCATGAGDGAYGVVIQSDGLIVVAGTSGAGWEGAVIRYTAVGGLDPTWGAGTGKVQSLIAAKDTVVTVAVQPDGKVVTAGSYNSAGWWGVVQRFTPTGGVDPSFGAGTGHWVSPWSLLNTGFTAVLVQPDGRIVAAASHCCYSAGVVRLNANGTIDTSFGTAGAVAHNAGGAGYGHGATLGADGRMVVTGYATLATNDVSTIVMGGQTVPDYLTGTTDWTIGTGFFGACLRAVSGAGVTGTWTVDATCPATSGVYWNAIATASGGASAKVASSPTSGVTNATASIRFGFRTAANQPPGRYTAPVVFEVLAPNA